MAVKYWPGIVETLQGHHRQRGEPMRTYEVIAGYGLHSYRVDDVPGYRYWMLQCRGAVSTPMVVELYERYKVKIEGRKLDLVREIKGSIDPDSGEESEEEEEEGTQRHQVSAKLKALKATNQRQVKGKGVKGKGSTAAPRIHQSNKVVPLDREELESVSSSGSSEEEGEEEEEEEKKQVEGRGAGAGSGTGSSSSSTSTGSAQPLQALRDNQKALAGIKTGNKALDKLFGDMNKVHKIPK